MLPCSLCKVPIRTPHINTSARQTILQVSFSNIVFTPASSNLLTKIRFMANARICRTSGSVLTLPPCNFNFTFLRPIILPSYHPLRRHHHHCIYHTHRTTLYGEWSERMHLSQSTMPHDLHVCLKKPSKNPHLHLRWFSPLQKEHHQIHFLYRSFRFTVPFVVPFLSAFPAHHLYRFSWRFRSPSRFISPTRWLTFVFVLGPSSYR